MLYVPLRWTAVLKRVGFLKLGVCLEQKACWKRLLRTGTA